MNEVPVDLLSSEPEAGSVSSVWLGHDLTAYAVFSLPKLAKLTQKSPDRLAKLQASKWLRTTKTRYNYSSTRRALENKVENNGGLILILLNRDIVVYWGINEIAALSSFSSRNCTHEVVETSTEEQSYNLAQKLRKFCSKLLVQINELILCFLSICLELHDI
jgi:hypothetical protein